MPHTEPSNLGADADSWATVVFQAGFINIYIIYVYIYIYFFLVHLLLRQFDEAKFVREIQKMRTSGGRGANF